MITTRLQSLFYRESPYAKTAAYYLCFVVLGLAMSAIGPVLPSLAEQTGSSLGGVSFLFTARSAGYLVGALVAGRLYDRYAGHPIVIASLLMIALAFALIPVAAVLILLVLLVVLLGVSEAGVDLGVNSMMIWIHGAAVSPFMNGLHFFFGLGALLAPVMFAQIVSVGWGSTTLFWAMAALVLAIVLVVSRLSSPKNVSQTEATGRAAAGNGLVLLIAIGFFLYVGIEVGLSGWIYTYALSAGLADEISAAYLTSAFWAAFTIGRLLSIPLARWYTPSHLLAVNVIGMLAGFSVLAFVSGSTALWVGTVLAGLSMASCFPSLFSLAGSKMAISARVTGRFFAGSSLGGMLVPWMIGQLFESGGPQYTIIVPGILSIFLAIVFFWIIILTRRQSKTT